MKKKKEANTCFVVLLGIRIVDIEEEKSCPKETQGYYFNFGWSQACLSPPNVDK